MDKVYAVLFEIVDEDGETDCGILNKRFYADRDEARKAMLRDFDETKSEYDNTDDLDENHSLDDAFLQVNMEWHENWSVLELTK